MLAVRVHQFSQSVAVGGPRPDPVRHEEHTGLPDEQARRVWHIEIRRLAAPPERRLDRGRRVQG
jgi:hypothetical protein